MPSLLVILPKINPSCWELALLASKTRNRQRNFRFISVFRECTISYHIHISINPSSLFQKFFASLCRAHAI